MLDILEWTLDVIGVTYRRLDGSICLQDKVVIKEHMLARLLHLLLILLSWALKLHWFAVLHKFWSAVLYAGILVKADKNELVAMIHVVFWAGMLSFGLDLFLPGLGLVCLLC
ncbi:DNA helicase [Sarracenia purpurea var. burkii]